MTDTVLQATTPSATAGAVKRKTSREEGKTTATARLEPPRMQACARRQVEEGDRKWKGGAQVLQQDTNCSNGVGAKAEEGTRGNLVSIVSDVGDGDFPRAGDGENGLGHPLAQPRRNNSNDEHRNSCASLSSPVDGESPPPTTEGGGRGASGNLGGTVAEHCRGRCGSSEEPSVSSSQSDIAASTSSADNRGDEGCAHCAQSCWFACSCACHAALAETLSVAAETENGNATRRRAPAIGPLPRKRPRNGQQQPRVKPSNQKEDERAHDVPDLDVERAFLATSESGARPRAIHFGTAARYPRPLLGRCCSDGEDTGTRITYDMRWVGSWLQKRFCAKDVRDRPWLKVGEALVTAKTCQLH